MKTGLSTLALNIALAGTLAPAALAQQGDPANQFVRNRFTAVQDRQQPEFDPEAIRLGTFIVNSGVSAAARYNDNIFGQSTNTTGDTILEFVPQADFRSDWLVHELDFGATVVNRNYLDNSDESSTDYSAYGRGRLDVTRNFALGASLNGAHVTENRYAPASQGAGPQAEYNRFGGEVSATYLRDRIQLDGRVGSTKDDFDNAIYNFRNSTTDYVQARAAYAISPAVSAFILGRSADISYKTIQPGFASRDAKQSNVQVGVNFELAAPFRGDIAVGYINNNNKSALRPDSKGLSVDARLLWFPTEITTVTINANRGVYDPGLPNSSSAFYTTYGVHVDHELRRNIILFGSLSGGKRDYEFQPTPPSTVAPSRTDDLFNADAGLAWKLNKHARVEAMYSYAKQDTSGFGFGFDNNTVSIGLKLYP